MSSLLEKSSSCIAWSENGVEADMVAFVPVIAIVGGRYRQQQATELLLLTPSLVFKQWFKLVPR